MKRLIGASNAAKGLVFLLMGLFLLGLAPAAAGRLPQAASPAWFNTVQAGIRQAEYHVTWQAQTPLPKQPAAYHAPNRAHNLRTYFTPQGIRLLPRAADSHQLPVTSNQPVLNTDHRLLNSDHWHWGLRLADYGRAGHARPAGPAEPLVAANRVEYHRDGLTEWYVNSEAGLVYGLVISEEFASANDGWSEDGPFNFQAASFVLEFSLSGGLLPSQMADGRTIDFTRRDGTPALRYGNLTATDSDGRSLPVHFRLTGCPDSSQLLVCEEFDAAHTRQPTILSPCRLTLVVDTTVARYPVTVQAAVTRAGELPFGRAIGPQTDAASPDPAAGDSDTTIDNTDTTITYDGWGGAADAQASGGGYRAAAEAGQKMSFKTPLPTVIEPNWTAESDQSLSNYGWVVNSAGDVNDDGYDDVMVGASWYDNGLEDAGRAYVYYGGPDGLSQSANWTAEGDKALANFGWTGGSAGDVNGDGTSDLVIGAYNYDNGDSTGRAFVYHGSASGLSLTPNWTAQNDQLASGFSNYVGPAGDVNGDGYDDIIVSSCWYDNPENDEGRTYVYHGSAAGLSLTPNWTAEGNQPGALFGESAETAGDVNGDGYADVMIGATRYDNGELNEGRAYIYHGSAGGLSTSPDWMVEANQAESKFGWRVGRAGDVNGDDYDDVILGAREYDNGQTDEGRAYVYYGGPDGASLTANWTAEGDQIGAYFGFSAGTAGDVNNDGYDDVIVGAYGYGNDLSGEGRAFVYQGSASGLSLTANWTAEGDQVQAHFGRSSASAGDVNGDGYDDVIISADDYDNGEEDEGRAYLYYGASSGVGTMDLSFITYTGPDQGLAQVTIDGQSQGILDLYAVAPTYQYRVTYADLAVGRHTIIIEVLGESNAAATGTEVRVDAFELPGFYREDTSPYVRYHGWSGAATAQAYGGDARYASQTGASVFFNFSGTQFAWITTRGPALGLAEVIVDGAVVATVDLYNPTWQWQYEEVISGLADAPHTVQIRALGTRNPASTGNTILFDAYRVP